MSYYGPEEPNVVECEYCGTAVEAFTAVCPGCGFDRSDPEPDHLEPEPDGPPWGYEDDSARPSGPSCKDCGEPMTAREFGWAPDTGHTVDYATCNGCGLGWGPVTGVVELEENER